MKILTPAERAELMRALDLPDEANWMYHRLAKTFFGDTAEEVMRFALINWLHEHHGVVLDVTRDR